MIEPLPASIFHRLFPRSKKMLPETISSVPLLAAFGFVFQWSIISVIGKADLAKEVAVEVFLRSRDVNQSLLQ